MALEFIVQTAVSHEKVLIRADLYVKNNFGKGVTK